MKKMILAGGSGFLGQTLAAHFANDYEIVVLTRTPRSHSPFREIVWDGRTLGP